MAELVILALLYGGGFVAAGLFMSVATCLRRRRSALISLFCLSLFSLLAQGGCYQVASGIGRATNGTGDISGLMLWVILSVLGCIVWGTLLFASKRSTERDDPSIR